MRATIKGTILFAAGAIVGLAVAWQLLARTYQYRPALLTLLDHVLEDVNFRDARMDEVIASLHDHTSANIVFNWRQTYGVDPSSRVTLRLGKTTLSSALDGLVQAVGVHDYPIAWRVEDRLIVIAPADQMRLCRVYDVRPLLREAMRFHDEVAKLTPNGHRRSRGRRRPTHHVDFGKDRRG
jgi:hypothetical protein